MSLPRTVADALERAERRGFAHSCEEGTGRLLRVLAAAVPEGGRILEVGTGVGVGCAWMVDGLGSRTDVEVISVENDPALAEEASSYDWPRYVRLVQGDVTELMPSLGTFDLIFPDAPAGKWTGLSRTIAALRLRGVLMVDDLIPKPEQPAEWNEYLTRTRDRLLSHAELVAVEINDLTGVVLAVRRYSPTLADEP